MLAAITGRHRDRVINSPVGVSEAPLALNDSVRLLEAAAQTFVETRVEPRLRVVAADVTEDGPRRGAHEQPNAPPKATRLELGPMAASLSEEVEEKLGFMLLQDGLITAQQLAQALDAQAASGHLLGRVLLDQKAVTPAQLESAIHAQNKGERPSTARILARLGVPPHHIQAIVDREQQTHETLPAIMRDWGFLSEEGVARTIAIQNNLPYFPRTEIDNIALTSLRARNIAVTDYRGFVPIAFKDDGKRGRIAVLIPDRNLRSPATSEFKNYDCAFMIASSNTIQTIYRRYFANTGEKVDALIKEYNDALAQKEDLSRSPIPLTLFMALLRHACYSGASDLQLFPSHDIGVVKIKIDGRWELLKVVSLDMLSRLFAVMRNNMLDKTSDEKLNQGFTDTALVMATDKDEQAQALREQYSDIIDRYVFRVEVGNPIQNGKTVTVRVNDRQATASDLSQLGLDAKTLKKLRDMSRANSNVRSMRDPALRHSGRLEIARATSPAEKRGMTYPAPTIARGHA